MDVNVYRDDQGVPHIVAESERSAWYALGYEQARDGLLWIQYAVKAARGELTWVRGDADGIVNDMAVQIFGAHLGSRSEAQLRQMFSPVNPAISASFYDNCVAFTDGVNAYREAVATATSASPELDLKNWLNANRFHPLHTLSWVYTDPIQPVDIMSQGGLVGAFWSFFRAEMPLVNSVGDSYSFTGNGPVEQPVDPDRSAEQLTSGAVASLFADLRRHASILPGAASAMSGSNTFAWSRLYCQDSSTTPPTTYAGLLADPHQGLPFHGPNFTSQFLRAANHMWFAHVQVIPAGSTQPTYDVFGHVPYAAAAFQSHHNRDIAVGGTQGGPNWTDHFLLRLEEGAGGSPALPHRYYSYYHDSGATNTTYQPITTRTLTIKRPDNVVVPVDYWTAQSFGVILPNLTATANYVATWTGPASPKPKMPVVYGERVDLTGNPPHWRVSASQRPPKMRYWNQPEVYSSGPNAGALRTSPMVVALRAPMHAEVAGNSALVNETMHWQLLRDFWEISHASTISEVAVRTNGAAYPVNLSCVDREGAIMTTQITAVPMRGDDAALQADGYSSVDKVLIYSGGAGPVPARHHKDKMFDWRFGTGGPPHRPAPLSYLEYPLQNPSLPPVLPPNNGPFKPITMQWQTGAFANTAFPPTNYPGQPAPFDHIEGGFFASACNDSIWGYSRNLDPAQFIAVAPGQPRPWQDITTNGANWLLEQVLQRGCAYQAQVLSFEGPDRQQIVVDRFTKQAERIVRGSGGLPAMTPAEMRQFVVTSRMYAEANYVSPSTTLADMPVSVRQVLEVLGNPTFRDQTQPDPLTVASPLERAKEELWFFRDLWTELNNPQSPWNAHLVQPGVQVSLKSLWVDANDPAHPNQVFWYDDPNVLSSARWLEMPSDFPLIDFLWSASELGSAFTAGVAAGTGTPAVVSAAELGPLTAYANGLWDPANWNWRSDPTSPGACLHEMLRMGYGARGPTYGRHWVRLQRGQQVPEVQAWESLQHLAFPLSQLGTLLTGGLNPPYDALYTNRTTHAVRTTLRAEDVNALVKFFLELGGHYIDPGENDGNPSRKLARWELANRSATLFMSFLPGSYPLTGGLERATVLRRVMDTKAFLASYNATNPALSRSFRARAYDHNGQKLWPAAADADCVGGGLRSVVWYETSVSVRDQGYQQEFLGMSGSYATLLTMFPSTGGVESWFWCTPGVQAMSADLRGAVHTAARFNPHMDAFSTNVLMRSHYSDFLSNIQTSLTHSYWL